MEYKFFQTDKGIFVYLGNYEKEILEKFHLIDCNSIATPFVANQKISANEACPLKDPTSFRSLIGSLSYICSTRPELMYLVSLLSRFMQQPTDVRLIAAKRILRYVKGNMSCGNYFGRMKKLKLIGYSDSDWVGSMKDSRSSCRYSFSFGNGVFSRNSHKQTIVA